MEGIVVKAIPYQDKHRIITVFTKENGLLSIMVRSLSQKDVSLQNITSPLALSEFHLEKGRGDLYHFRDATLLDSFLPLRSDFDKLLQAGKMLKAINQTQYPEKPAPLLFELLKIYLNKMKFCPSSKSLLLSFYMKLLRHEGILPETNEDAHFPLTQAEWKIVTLLSYSTSFEKILSLVCEESFEKKLLELFASCTNLCH